MLLGTERVEMENSMIKSESSIHNSDNLLSITLFFSFLVIVHVWTFSRHLGHFSYIFVQMTIVFQKHTHTHPFNGPFSGTTRVSRNQKGKPIWILLEQETVSSSGISWAKMQICNSLQTDNHASFPPLSF